MEVDTSPQVITDDVTNVPIRRSGFKIPHKTARLVFEGDEMDGCEVIVSLELSIEGQKHLDALKKGEDTDAVLKFFAGNCIASWNILTDEDEPMAITGEQLIKMPGWMSLLILNGWGAAVKEATDIPDPLEPPSKNGVSSEEPSATMEKSLASQSN